MQLASTPVSVKHGGGCPIKDAQRLEEHIEFGIRVAGMPMMICQCYEVGKYISSSTYQGMSAHIITAVLLSILVPILSFLDLSLPRPSSLRLLSYYSNLINQ